MWQLDALCAKVDPELFFPDKGGSTRDAKRVCGECTVKGQCLAFAIENDQRFGIWGGTSERERRSIRRKLKKIVAFEPIPYTKVNASGG
ncbi:MAG: WhiB family transcriptional regulator [Candidatus Ancillula sp.]|nr:WhiB family transcriptional regulator [Candidatus Ancillula sp.]